MDALIGSGADVITLLLLFIVGLLTKRFVPWWVHEEALRKLREYEEAAPELITQVQRLVKALDEKQKEQPHNPHAVQTRIRAKRKDRNA